MHRRRLYVHYWQSLSALDPFHNKATEKPLESCRILFGEGGKISRELNPLTRDVTTVSILDFAVSIGADNEITMMMMRKLHSPFVTQHLRTNEEPILT
jgi:hypothetical protein